LTTIPFGIENTREVVVFRVDRVVISNQITDTLHKICTYPPIKQIPQNILRQIWLI